MNEAVRGGAQRGEEGARKAQSCPAAAAALQHCSGWRERLASGWPGACGNRPHPSLRQPPAGAPAHEAGPTCGGRGLPAAGSAAASAALLHAVASTILVVVPLPQSLLPPAPSLPQLLERHKIHFANLTCPCDAQPAGPRRLEEALEGTLSCAGSPCSKQDTGCTADLPGRAAPHPAGSRGEEPKGTRLNMGGGQTKKQRHSPAAGCCCCCTAEELRSCRRTCAGSRGRPRPGSRPARRSLRWEGAPRGGVNSSAAEATALHAAPAAGCPSCTRAPRRAHASRTAAARRAAPARSPRAATIARRPCLISAVLSWKARSGLASSAKFRGSNTPPG